MKSKSFNSAYTKMYLIPSALYEKIIGKMDNIEKEEMFEINKGDDDQTNTETTPYSSKENTENDTNDADNTDIDTNVNQSKGMNTQTDLSTFKEESMQRNPSGIDEESANTVVPILLHTLVKRC